MLQDAIDALDDVAWVAEVGPPVRIRYLGLAYERVFGLAVAGCYADPWDWLAGVHPDDRDRVVETFKEGFKAGAVDVTHRVLRPDGSTRWIRNRGRLSREGAAPGAAGSIVGVATDVTSGVAALETERALREVLEARVAERTAELAEEAIRRAAAQDALRQAQKMEALGQLVGGIAHDFNNALAVVLAGLTLLQKRHGAALEAAGPGAARLLASVREGAERGAVVSQRLLAFARREELRAATLEPEEVLNRLREVLNAALGHTVSVRVDAPPGLPPLHADRAQLETALINLAVNARDAMPGGGVVVLGAEAARVDAEQAARLRLPEGAYVRLEVTDTGIGMDAATLMRAAEPFFTTKPKGKGTGLGLAMVDGFATQSGGALQMVSEPGRGTNAYLWLPQAPAASEAPAAAVPPSPRRRALVVDDKPMMRRFLVECLRHEHWDAAEAEDAGRALVRLEADGDFALLITDLAMPGMDGLALIQAARKERPDLPAVLVTGTSSVGELAPVAADSGFAVLRKPVSPAELADLLAALPTSGKERGP